MYYGWRTIEGTNNGENAKYTFKPTPFNNLTEGTNYDVYCASKSQTPKPMLSSLLNVKTTGFEGGNPPNVNAITTNSFNVTIDPAYNVHAKCVVYDFMNSNTEPLLADTVYNTIEFSDDVIAFSNVGITNHGVEYTSKQGAKQVRGGSGAPIPPPLHSPYACAPACPVLTLESKADDMFTPQRCT